MSDLHDLIPATSSLCLTPPATPSKKRSNASEDELAPQKKKCRLLKFDETNAAQHPSASCSSDDVSGNAQRDDDVMIQGGCQGEISSSIAWQVSFLGNSDSFPIDLMQREFMSCGHLCLLHRLSVFLTLSRFCYALYISMFLFIFFFSFFRSRFACLNPCLIKTHLPTV